MPTYLDMERTWIKWFHQQPLNVDDEDLILEENTLLDIEYFLDMMEIWDGFGQNAP